MKRPVLMIAALALLVSACGREEAAQTTSAPAAPESPAATTTPAPEPAPESPTATVTPAPAQVPAEEPPAKPAVAAAGAGSVLSLEEGTALARSSGCFACHDKELKRQIIGPAWGAVAERYRGNPDARDRVMQWVHTGGTGRWGTAVMPPYSPRVPDNEIEKLVDFILSLPDPA